MTNEYSGGKTSYYQVDVISPVDERSDPYTAECQDIIEALGMDFNEGNAFKALWRRAAARLGKSKRGYTDGLYDAEKVEFYGRRLVELEQRERKVAGAEQVELPGVAPVFEWVDPDPIVQKHLDKLFAGEVTLPESLLGAAVEKLALDIFGPRDAEGWYAWNGDSSMRPAGQVEYEMRSCGDLNTGEAEGLRWMHNGGSGDIVKWRPAPVKETRLEDTLCIRKGCFKSRVVGNFCEEHEPIRPPKMTVQPPPRCCDRSPDCGCGVGADGL